EAEEQCCDAWVVWALPRSARSYALALVETVDFLSESRSALPVAASGVGQVRPLRRRLTMIMRGTTPRDLTWGGFLALLVAGALLLPILPIWAQDAPPAAPKPEKPRERRAEPDRPDKARAAEADRERAEAELKRARAEVERARAQLAQAEATLRAIMSRLATEGKRPEGQGKRPEGQGKKLILLIQDGKETRRIELPSEELPSEFLKRVLVLSKGAERVPGEFGKKLELKIRGVAPDKKPGGADTERRLEELERRLKELLRDVDQLRGQMRPRDGSGK
ncbi:MAG TPA: hypothetical protein VFA26_00855, partial [Gemmataceae bacterium]|nr:hypothetical protein [Gemmataceae bacterium]